MKKLSLLLMAVAFLCPKNSNAQDGEGSVHFVPYVGVNYSDLSGDLKLFWGETSGKVNITLGARFEYKMSDKSVLLADYNYRRLGANLDGELVSINDYIKDKYGLNKRLIEDKVIFDCHSFGVQYKHNILCGLSARAGIEVEYRSQTYHRYYAEFYDPITNTRPVVDDIYLLGSEGYCKDNIDEEGYKGYSDSNVNMPLGLTYDYKSFCVNATYHLPLTKCVKDGDYFLRHQAFDLTIGYRLPLRKR